MSEFVKSSFVISDFFPRLDWSDKKRARDAWTWLGDVHAGFGGYSNAMECFRCACEYPHSILFRPRFIILVGTAYFFSPPIVVLRSLLRITRINKVVNYIDLIFGRFRRSKTL